MALNTDIFFVQALMGNADIKRITQGRIFDPARPEIDEQEDKIPYIIVSHDGTQNSVESKDDECDSDMDTDTISVLVVDADREKLATLSELVRKTVRSAAQEYDEHLEDELGFCLNGYTFSAGAVEYDAFKPCTYVTLTYNCETYINE